MENKEPPTKAAFGGNSFAMVSDVRDERFANL